MSEDREKPKEYNDVKKYKTWNIYRDVKKDMWERIDSPQFVDFNRLSNADIPYFDQTETPKIIPQSKKQTESVPSPNPDDEVANILQAGLSLSNIKQEETSHRGNGAKVNLHEPSTSKHVRNDNQSEKRIVPKQQKTGNRHCTKLNPFSFDANNKRMLERKEEHIKKILEEERRMFPVFYAKPVPRYFKARAPKPHSNISTNPSSTAQGPVPSASGIGSGKKILHSQESRKSTIAKSPILHTARRARQRAEFDNIIKQKEAQLEIARKYEEENAKKMEQNQIAKLRRQLTHKANPIRTYQQLPPREKRQLTEPITPLVCKRRRFH